MKQFSLILFLLAASISIQGQSLHFGPRIGLNFTNIVVNDFKDGSRTRIHMGVFGWFDVTDQVAVQAEALYNQLGTYNKQAFTTGPVSMDYLGIPLLAKYKPASVPLLSGYAGPQIGFLLSSILKSDDTGQKENIDEDVKGLDLGLLLGAEYEVYEGLNAGLRYSTSLLDMHPNANKVAKHQTFQITLSYDLSLAQTQDE